MAISLGMIEYNSIAKGIKCADEMLKSSYVSLLSSKTTCPGKYITMISGDVDAVNNSIQSALLAGGGHVVDHLIIPRVDSTVCSAISGTSATVPKGALGVMEFFGMAAAIMAADIAVKTADVHLLEIRLGMGIGGKAFVTLCGDVSAVKESVAVGSAKAAEEGFLVGSCVIPSAKEELFLSLL